MLGIVRKRVGINWEAERNWRDEEKTERNGWGKIQRIREGSGKAVSFGEPRGIRTGIWLWDAA